jgi:hypothetical protein
VSDPEPRSSSHPRFRSTRAAAVLGISALAAYLLLPIAHALSAGTSEVVPAHAGAAYEESEAAGHSPLGCPICDRLGHARHGLATPAVAEAPVAALLAEVATLVSEQPRTAPALDTALARAPPAPSLFA